MPKQKVHGPNDTVPEVESYVEPGVKPRPTLAETLKDELPKGKKRQYELSEIDLEYLGKKGYSKSAWSFLGERYSFDPTTVEMQDEKTYTDDNGTERPCPPTFLALPTNRRYRPNRPKNVADAIVSTRKMRGIAEPETDETHTEEV